MELNNDDEAGLAPRFLLGRRLRCLCERAGVSLRSLADAVHYPHSYISRVERGKQLPSRTLPEALDAYFRTDGVMVESLATARRTTIPRYGRAIVNNELAATRIQVFGGSVILGLLQTEGYARALFRASLLDVSDEQIEGHVATRLKRKVVLEESNQLRYEAVVDEVVLQRKMGGAACMADQLRALLRIAEMPRVTVQVLPFERGRASAAGWQSELADLRQRSHGRLHRELLLREAGKDRARHAEADTDVLRRPRRGAVHRRVAHGDQGALSEMFPGRALT